MTLILQLKKDLSAALFLRPNFNPVIIMVKSGLILFSAFSLFSCCLSAVVNGRQASTIPLPPLPGSNAVGTIALELIDKSRPDPYVPPQPRKVSYLDISEITARNEFFFSAI